MLGTASSDGYFTRLNPAWERALGWTAEELMAKRLISFVHPDDVQATREVVAQLAGSSDRSPVVGFENRYRTREGDYRWIEWTAVAEGDGFCFVARDVTDRRAMEDSPRAAATEQHETEVLVRHSDALHRILTANLPDTSVFLIDHDLRILVADGEAVRRLPWFSEDLFRGRTVTDLYAEVPADVLDLCLEHYRATLGGERREFEMTSAGLTFAIQSAPISADDGTVESALIVVRDISERTLSRQQIERRERQQNAVAELGRFALQSQDLARLMSEAVTTASTTLDVEIAGVLELDLAADRLTVASAVGLPALAGVPGDAPPPIPLEQNAEARHAMRTGEPTIIEDWDSGTYTKPAILAQLGVVSSASVPIAGHEGLFGLLVVHAREPLRFSRDDVAFLSAIANLIGVAVERERKDLATRHAALHDPLTGLPNRTLALDRLGEALARHQQGGTEVAVLALDLDRFKIINDSLGHAAGDEALLLLAPRLSEAVRPGDTVARMGGDEFLVICPDIDAARGAQEIAERLATTINRPLALKSGEHFFTVSTGITLARPGDSPESLIRDADAAMYRAKDRGRGRHELFDAALHNSIITRMRTEAELRRALDNGEIKVWYQSVIHLATGQPISTEALARWEHPERGLIGPLEFISIAEESGLIAELGRQILEEACYQTAIWQQHIHPGLTVSVNVSGQQVINPKFPSQVGTIADRSGMSPGTLALEITESVLMEEADSPATVLGALHDRGLILVLDDFGTGYSSLSRLKALPLDELKIDRSFVSGIEANIDDRAIVKATVDMARAMGLKAIAEGVETTGQAELLVTLGCDHAQGYLYCRPQPAHAMTSLLAARRTSRERPTKPLV